MWSIDATRSLRGAGAISKSGNGRSVVLLVDARGSSAPASAAADLLQVQVQSSTPEQAVPVSRLFSGTAGAVDPRADGPELDAEVRPAGGVVCQPVYESGQSAGGVSTYLTYALSETAPRAFQETATFSPPNTTAYLVGAWLEDGDSNTAADQAIREFVRHRAN